MKKLLHVWVNEEDLREFNRIGRTPWMRITDEQKKEYSRLEYRLAAAVSASWVKSQIIKFMEGGR